MIVKMKTGVIVAVLLFACSMIYAQNIGPGNALQPGQNGRSLNSERNGFGPGNTQQQPLNQNGNNQNNRAFNLDRNNFEQDGYYNDLCNMYGGGGCGMMMGAGYGRNNMMGPGMFGTNPNGNRNNNNFGNNFGGR